MANNFRLSGGFYCAQSSLSSDANSGLTADLPKRSFTQVCGISDSASSRIVASGDYFGGFTTGSYVNNINLFADGIVFLSGNGGNGYFSGGAAYTASMNFTGFNFRNFANLGRGTSGSGNRPMNFTDCTFNTITRIGDNLASTKTFTRCTFIGATFNDGLAINFNDCKFFNCTFLTIGVFTRCYLDAATIVYSAVVAGVGDNLFEGHWKVNVASVATSGILIDNLGKYYDLSLAGSGGTGDIGTPFFRGNTINKSFALAYHIVAYPTMNTRSIASSPLFNNVSVKDFNVSLASPMLARNSVNNITIGDAKYALGFYPNVTAEFLEVNGAIISGLSGTTDLTVTSGSGYIRSAPILFGSSGVLQVGKIDYLGALTFDKPVTPPVARNQNVPDSDVYSSTVAGATPDRLVFDVRVSSKNTAIHFVSLSGTSSVGSNVITMVSTTGILVGDEIAGDGIPIGTTVSSIVPNTSITISANSTKAVTKYFAFTAIADWDNLGIASPGTFFKAPWGEVPYYDNSGVASGLPNFNSVQLNPVGATYIQIIATLTNSFTI